MTSDQHEGRVIDTRLRRRVKRWVQMCATGVSVIAVFALILPLSRERVLTSGAVVLVLASVMALYDRTATGRGPSVPS